MRYDLYEALTKDLAVKGVPPERVVRFVRALHAVEHRDTIAGALELHFLLRHGHAVNTRLCYMYRIKGCFRRSIDASRGREGTKADKSAVADAKEWCAQQPTIRLAVDRAIVASHEEAEEQVPAGATDKVKALVRSHAGGVAERTALGGAGYEEME